VCACPHRWPAALDRAALAPDACRPKRNQDAAAVHCNSYGSQVTARRGGHRRTRWRTRVVFTRTRAPDSGKRNNRKTRNGD
jgi:hypothetical protein